MIQKQTPLLSYFITYYPSKAGNTSCLIQIFDNYTQKIIYQTTIVIQKDVNTQHYKNFMILSAFIQRYLNKYYYHDGNLIIPKGYALIIFYYEFKCSKIFKSLTKLLNNSSKKLIILSMEDLFIFNHNYEKNQIKYKQFTLILDQATDKVQTLNPFINHLITIYETKYIFKLGTELLFLPFYDITRG